jgi:hypothetical protein
LDIARQLLEEMGRTTDVETRVSLWRAAKKYARRDAGFDDMAGLVAASSSRR